MICSKPAIGYYRLPADRSERAMEHFLDEFPSIIQRAAGVRLCWRGGRE